VVPWLLTYCQAVSGPKTDYWNGTSTKDKKIKSTLKGFQDSEDIQNKNNKNVMALKAILQQQF
jgi:hypothetical protein